MQSSHTFSVESAVFDEPNLVSAAGLVPVLELAEQTGLSRLISEHVELPSTQRRKTPELAAPAGQGSGVVDFRRCDQR